MFYWPCKSWHRGEIFKFNCCSPGDTLQSPNASWSQFPSWLRCVLCDMMGNTSPRQYMHQLLVFFENWGIDALWCCAGICSSALWSSYVYTPIPPTLHLHPPPPSPSRLGHHGGRAELPGRPAGSHSSVLHTWLFTLVSLSPSSSHLPFPHTTSTHLFSTSASLFLSCK